MFSFPVFISAIIVTGSLLVFNAHTVIKGDGLIRGSEKLDTVFFVSEYTVSFMVAELFYMGMWQVINLSVNSTSPIIAAIIVLLQPITLMLILCIPSLACDYLSGEHYLTVVSKNWVIIITFFVAGGIVKIMGLNGFLHLSYVTIIGLYIPITSVITEKNPFKAFWYSLKSIFYGDKECLIQCNKLLIVIIMSIFIIIFFSFPSIAIMFASIISGSFLTFAVFILGILIWLENKPDILYGKLTRADIAFAYYASEASKKDEASKARDIIIDNDDAFYKFIKSKHHSIIVSFKELNPVKDIEDYVDKNNIPSPFIHGVWFNAKNLNCREDIDKVCSLCMDMLVRGGVLTILCNSDTQRKNLTSVQQLTDLWEVCDHKQNVVFLFKK